MTAQQRIAPMSDVTKQETVEAGKDHARIWLEPWPGDGANGRTWCQDKVWPAEEGDPEPTEYIRADLALAAAPVLAVGGPVAWRYRSNDLAVWSYGEGGYPRGVGAEIVEPLYTHPSEALAAKAALEIPTPDIVERARDLHEHWGGAGGPTMLLEMAAEITRLREELRAVKAECSQVCDNYIDENQRLHAIAAASTERAEALESEMSDWRNGDLRGVQYHMDKFAEEATEQRERAEKMQRALEHAHGFIEKLVHMQSGQGWTRAVVREAANDFLVAVGATLKRTPGDTTPDLVASEALSTSPRLSDAEGKG